MSCRELPGRDPRAPVCVAAAGRLGTARLAPVCRGTCRPVQGRRLEGPVGREERALLLRHPPRRLVGRVRLRRVAADTDRRRVSVPHLQRRRAAVGVPPRVALVLPPAEQVAEQRHGVAAPHRRPQAHQRRRLALRLCLPPLGPLRHVEPLDLRLLPKALAPRPRRLLVDIPCRVGLIRHVGPVKPLRGPLGVRRGGRRRRRRPRFGPGQDQSREEDDDADLRIGGAVELSPPLVTEQATAGLGPSKLANLMLQHDALWEDNVRREYAEKLPSDPHASRNHRPKPLDARCESIGSPARNRGAG